MRLGMRRQELRPFIAFCHRQFFANISQFMKPRSPHPFCPILLPFALFILLHLTLLMNYWPQQMAALAVASSVAFPPLRTSKAFCLSSAKPFLRFPINFSFTPNNSRHKTKGRQRDRERERGRKTPKEETQAKPNRN